MKAIKNVTSASFGIRQNDIRRIYKYFQKSKLFGKVESFDCLLSLFVWFQIFIILIKIKLYCEMFRNKLYGYEQKPWSHLCLRRVEKISSRHFYIRRVQPWNSEQERIISDNLLCKICFWCSSFCVYYDTMRFLDHILQKKSWGNNFKKSKKFRWESSHVHLSLTFTSESIFTGMSCQRALNFLH